MPIVGDVYMNNKTGRLATVLYDGSINGIWFMQFSDDTVFGTTIVILLQRWTKQ